MYKILRSILFLFNGEKAHNITTRLLVLLRYLPFSKQIVNLLYGYHNPVLEREVFGIRFKNPVGLAAGFDKNGTLYNDLAKFGFSFVEIGSLTLEPQPGNPKPRCFRLVQDNAIINRMGINNNGVRYAVNYIKKHHPNCIIGGNISKNSDVPNENAASNYEKSFALLYDFVDYFTINVSCPNVQNLDKMQDISFLSELIDRLLSLRNYYDDYRPILIKLSPDIPKQQLDDIIDLVLVSGIDGVIASNTTRDRSGLKTSKETLEEIGNGGLSGKPLFEKSLSMVKYISEKTNRLLPIVAVGGIFTPKDAEAMIDAGASLVQIYSGMIYNGPGLVKRINKHLATKFLSKQ
ncbi:MAG: quinone-dependent dihydroorotate dehydrogenase [bacterium]|nr:quinone-dependent dihydroorotate dehydrogenase [bacterium]